MHRDGLDRVAQSAGSELKSVGSRVVVRAFGARSGYDFKPGHGA